MLAAACVRFTALVYLAAGGRAVVASWCCCSTYWGWVGDRWAHGGLQRNERVVQKIKQCAVSNHLNHPSIHHQPPTAIHHPPTNHHPPADPEEAARLTEEVEAALLEGDRVTLRQFNVSG